MMRCLIADTRPSSTGHGLEDRHREEWVLALTRTLPDADFHLLTPGMDGSSDVSAIANLEPWNLNGREWLRFVQRTVPQEGERIDAQVIFCLFGGAPLVNKVPMVPIASGHYKRRDRSILGRLAYATGMAGVNGATLQIRWADLPTIKPAGTGLLHLEPWVHPAFSPESTPDDQIFLDHLRLTRGYILTLGLTSDDLEPLLSAWRRVVDVHGEGTHLVLVGLDPLDSNHALQFVESSDTPMDVRFLDAPALDQLPGLYRQAGLLLHGRSGSSGQGLRWGLACGVPIVAFDREASASIVGDAAYLVNVSDHRALTGAVLSILVQEDFADDLRKRALARALTYHRNDPLLPLTQALQGLIQT